MSGNHINAPRTTGPRDGAEFARFELRLRHFRSQLLTRYAAAMVAECALFAPALLPAVCSGRCRVPVICLVGFAAAAFLISRLCEMPWELSRCAAIADLDNGGRSPVVNAWEAKRSGAFFVNYIAALGLRAIPDAPRRRPAARLPWKSAGVLLLASLVCWGVTAVPAGAGEAKRSSQPVTAAELRASEPGAPGMEDRRDLRDARAAGRSGRAADEVPRTKPAASIRAAVPGGVTDTRSPAGDAAADAGPGGDVDRDGENKSEATDPGLAASGGGEADPGEATEENPGASAPAGTTRTANKRRSAPRRNARRKAETPPVGYAMTAFDSHPPAGREAANKDEHGDRPGDGRGGETGAKKARGVGTTLPVIPLPDSVAGRLSPGADATAPHPRHGDAAEGGSAATAKRQYSPNAPEPPLVPPCFTSQVRQRLRTSPYRTVTVPK